MRRDLKTQLEGGSGVVHVHPPRNWKLLHGVKVGPVNFNTKQLTDDILSAAIELLSCALKVLIANVQSIHLNKCDICCAAAVTTVYQRGRSLGKVVLKKVKAIRRSDADLNRVSLIYLI